MAKYNEKILRNKYLKHIRAMLQSGLLVLMDDIIDFQEDTYEGVEAPDSLREIEESIVRITLTLESYLDMNITEREEVINKLEDYKKVITEILEEIFCIASMRNLIMGIIERSIVKNHVAGAERKVIGYEAFYEECIRFVNEGAEETPVRIALLMSRLPLTITRERYYDYVKRCITAVCEKGFPYDLLESIKTRFLPTGNDCFGKNFPHFKEKFVELLMVDYENCGEDLLNEKTEELIKTNDVFEPVKEYVQLLYKTAKSLLMILRFTVDNEHLFDDTAIKDLYYTVKEHGGKGSFEAYEERHFQTLDDLLSASLEEIERGENNKALNLSTEELAIYSEKIQRLTNSMDLLRESYYGIEDYRIFQDGQPFAPEEGANLLIDYMRESVKGLRPKLQKYLRQEFLALLPSDFTLDEFWQHMKSSFENAASYEEKLMALEGVTRILVKSGFLHDAFFDDLDDEDLEEEDI